MRVVQKLANTLKEKKLTIAFAESITCGMLAQQMGNISGTSEVLMGSIICYHTSVKLKLMNIDPKLIAACSAESPDITNELAKNLKNLIDADIHAAITGLSAEGGSESKSKPKGTVFFSVFFKNTIHQHYFKTDGSPLQIKKNACDEMFRFVLKVIKQQ